MYKIGVIGDFESIYGYSALGLDIYDVGDKISAEEKLKSLAKNDYAIIYVTEKYFDMMLELIEQYDELPLPAIIPIPGVSGNSGIGIKRVSKSVEKAVGSDIL